MKINSFNSNRARKLLPMRHSHQNKTHGGKTLVIAGQKGYLGAAILAATAAARVGSGYTTLMTDVKSFPIHRHPDFLILSKTKAPERWKIYQAIAVGPGLSVTNHTERIIRSLLKNKIDHVVLDADALTVVAQKNIYPLRPSWLLTPHTGELERLLKNKIPTQSKTRKLSEATKTEKLKALHEAYQIYQCPILLKGRSTLIISSKATVQEVSSGNSALAKAGTGDVLTGIIAGFLAQGLSTEEAASLGAYVHGLCSQIWVKEKKDHLSLLASDLLDLIPQALWILRRRLNPRINEK